MPLSHVDESSITRGIQFFGLFGLSNRASSLIGPNIVQAIIDKSGNNWEGFPFLFALCTCACLVIWFGTPTPPRCIESELTLAFRCSRGGRS